MSNHLAIATVTASLSARIQEALAQDVPDASVRVGRPDDNGAQDNRAVVNLFLYHVTPNGALRNAHLPVRGTGGRIVARPRVALDLHYLFSFYGDAATYQPERMLGSTVRALEEFPLLTRSQIEKVIDDNPLTLSNSNLHRAEELVRVQPSSLNLEDLSKLWSVFFQVPYALSVAYQCTYVLVEADVAAAPTLPAMLPAIGLIPIGGPRIEAIEAIDGAEFPIVWGGAVRIRGQGFGTFGLGLRVGTIDVVMSEGVVGTDVIELPLTEEALGGADLSSGIHAVRTILPPPEGAPSHLERTSDSAPLVLRSKLTIPADGIEVGEPAFEGVSGTLQVEFSPKIQAGQEVKLFLDERVSNLPRNYVLAPEAMDEGEFPAGTLTFPFTGIRASTYLVRAHVDGIESAMEIEMDADNPNYRQITGPEVQIE